MNWLAWINQNWQSLQKGAKIPAPSWLPAPVLEGFVSQKFADPNGQVADWTLSLTDRSRIHIHEFADGRRIVHRDVHDPDQGFGDMVEHLSKETIWGTVIGIAVVGFLIAKMK